jgi:DNA repair exonuclease SbcCD ATPase subunit
MIIRSFEIHNFLRFFGTSVMRLNGHEGDRSSTLALILAPNDSGKTSLIRALEFLFYGTVDGKSGDRTIAALVNDEAVRRSRDRGSEGYVQATLSSKGVELTVRRIISVKSLGKSERRVSSVALESLVKVEKKKKNGREMKARSCNTSLKSLSRAPCFNTSFFKARVWLTP